MSKELSKTFGEESLPSVIKDPFSKINVTRIRVTYMKGIFDDEFSASGTVAFTNGETKGEQEFEGETFDEVVLKIRAMLENLK